MEEQRRLVFVDDDKSYLKTLKDFAEHILSGFECVCFSNPVDALQYVKEEAVDVVVSDLEMPQMTGFKLAEKILEVLPQTRIIVMSGHDKRYLEQLAEKEGIAGKVELLCKSSILNIGDILNS
jgi:YesN/AraC family two-component response regulator